METPRPSVVKDFFISYNSADQAWAEWIAWVLEENGYTVVYQAWDFRPGGNFILDMQRATEECQRTIMVLSENYLKAKYTQPEWAAAFRQDPTAEEQKLIPVRIAPCQPQGMLGTITRVDLLGLQRDQAQQVLLDALERERRKPDFEPTFPGGAVPAAERVTLAPQSFPGEVRGNLPRSGATKFVGREDDLMALHGQIQTSSQVAISAIAGMGGIGKTELALQYGRQYGPNYGAVCWLQARDREVASQIVNFAQTYLGLTPPDTFEELPSR